MLVYKRLSGEYGDVGVGVQSSLVLLINVLINMYMYIS